MNATPHTKLQTCKLCQKRPATQTGSHIFNSALIKGAVNAEGETKREKEISYTIRSGVGIETYFGRELSTNKIEETLGREMSEHEIATNINPYTVDHLICSDCEKRIERIENYFMSNVYNKLEKGRFSTTSADQDLLIATCDGIDENLVRLYFYSLAWRAMEVKFGNSEFEEKEKEFLRKVLDENLDLDINITDKNAKANKDAICQLPLIINYLTTTGDSSENVIYSGKSKRPYFFLLNDISFQLFFNKKWVQSHNEFFGGLFKFQKVKNLVNLGPDNPIKVGVVSERFRKDVVLSNINKYLARIETKLILNDFSEIHQKYFGDKPTEQDFRELFGEYLDDSVPMGVRYSIERKFNIFARKIVEIAKKKGFFVQE